MVGPTDIAAQKNDNLENEGSNPLTFEERVAMVFAEDEEPNALSGRESLRTLIEKVEIRLSDINNICGVYPNEARFEYDGYAFAVDKSRNGINTVSISKNEEMFSIQVSATDLDLKLNDLDVAHFDTRKSAPYTNLELIIEKLDKFMMYLERYAGEQGLIATPNTEKPDELIQRAKLF
jgi:hypothetical protein